MAAIADRPAVKRGRTVNRFYGEPSLKLHERHDASDFELRTEDKKPAPDGEAVDDAWQAIEDPASI